MGRGVGYSGGQSSLGYLLGGRGDTQPSTPPLQKPNDVPKPSQNTVEPSDSSNTMETDAKLSEKPSSSEPLYSVINQNPKADAHDSMTNNYHRVDGQNCGNFVTNRLSTKVHAPPGGKSSLGYMFGGDNK